ncbi:hypothetical protein FQN54_002875 [Arachnomyces sp. PD_36]|nr:hypothetical protein FQN54_002875 [Arachnomyces sp. PD_36]
MSSIPASASPSSRLERLPLEIAQAVLASLDDTISLLHAALTGPFLFNVLRSAEESITTQVLVNQLSPTLIHDALIVQESAPYRKGDRSHDQVIELIGRYVEGMRTSVTPSSSMRWTLSKALPLAEFHGKIELLSSRLVSEALSSNPASRRPDPSPVPPSKGEIHRIQRAIYRLEIYCNIFWDRSSFTFEECNRQNLAFFACFSPWENEQIACIRDYIFKILTSVFKSAALDDLNWLIYFTHRRLDNSFLEHQLHHGISHITHLLTSKPRYRPLPLSSPSSASPFPPPGRSPTTNTNRTQPTRAINLLTTDLENVYVDLERHERWDLSKRLLAVYDSADEKQYIPAPVTPDADSGPEEVWRWAHDLEPVMYFVAAYGQAPLRGWGYVFWDLWRLEQWGVFRKDWERVEIGVLVEEEARGMREFEERLERRARREGIMIKDIRVR